MIEKKLKIDGMHCGSCAMTIDEGLEELAGVAKAKTSYRKQSTSVTFDESLVDLDAIEKTIRGLGYVAARA